MWKIVKDILLSRENWIVLLLWLLVIALIVATADHSPLWIYQGF